MKLIGALIRCLQENELTIATSPHAASCIFRVFFNLNNAFIHFEFNVVLYKTKQKTALPE
jgi:hypothetical protein